MSLFEIRDLKIDFQTRMGTVQAVRGVSFDIEENECVALVGESGCGKSVTARSLIGLTDVVGGKVTGGEVWFEGKNIMEFSESEWRAYRGDKAAMVFQDAMTALNPTMRIGKQIWECFRFHQNLSKKEASQKALELLEKVSIPNARRALRSYPHEFSGGMRQLIGIARALAVNPEFILCDEPISALDVSIQAQIINLLMDLREQKGLTYLMISHDLNMVKHISDRIIVMYLGKIVETCPAVELYEHPAHPYTQALISAIPIADPRIERERERIILSGQVPSPSNKPKGCAFAGRCRFATPRCLEEEPCLREIAPGHQAACHLL